MDSKSQPAPIEPPDPNQLIGLQADVNRLDQFTPFGNLTFGGPDRREATLALDPAIQNIFNQQLGMDQGLLGLSNQALGGIGSLIGSPLTDQGLPSLAFDLGQLPQGPGLQRQIGGLDFSGASALPGSAQQFRDDVTGAFFDRSATQLNRQFGRDEERLRQTLANQGLQVGSEAFGEQIGDFQRNRGETFANLARDATLFGGQEASRALGDTLALRGVGTGEAAQQFGAGLTQGQFGNQAGLQQFGVQQQGLQNLVQQINLQNQARSLGLNQDAALRANQFLELGNLLGLQQVQPQGLSSFFGPGQVNAIDPFSLEQNTLRNNYNIGSGIAAGNKGAGAGLLGSLGAGLLDFFGTS